MNFNHYKEGGSNLPFNLNSNHPLIPNSQDYALYRKYISIHSEDRDITKYPDASSFEIELPEDYLNIITARVADWTFPANYSTFSLSNGNLKISFQITQPYNPGEHAFSNQMQEAIFDALYSYQSQKYLVVISPGFYNPDQMVTELTNRFNAVVTEQIVNYMKASSSYSSLVDSFLLEGGYNQFVVVYNTVKQNIWFGNRSSGFTIITNDPANNAIEEQVRCLRPQLPDFSNYGLASFVGLPRCNVAAESIVDFVPRFYYGDVKPGDNGFWLTPDPSLPGSQVFFIECPNKINLMGPSYMYLEVDPFNCIDETSPFNLSRFTMTTNQTNGIVNSALAKIPIPTTPLSQWFDKESLSYKLFLPPAERVRKIKIRLRYHNGELVNFGNYNYSFTLEFTLYSSQQMRKYNVFTANPHL